MKALHLTALTLAIATGFAVPLAGSAEAAMSVALPSTQLLPVEKAGFFFGGRNFCWYDGGWQGAGYYWCGYAWNNGVGWGGGEGWNGWNHGSTGAHNGPSGEAPRVHTGGAPGHITHASSGPPPRRPGGHSQGGHINKT
jgi:hypothetical protein